jgi:pyruvate/2-oxoglutarate/acetoin dehydrogenase E1 component/TPP-dependent pyruvate/acetoin dehydrogenase alpha subunit
MSNFSLSIHQSGLSSQQTLLNDFRLAWISREASLLGRKEVLTGKAKFGIFGDGKELAQIAMARAFKKGDWRSGYYRDQTFMMAIGELTVRQYFAALYAHTDIQQEPASGGRQMGGHYATRTLDENGEWKNLMEMYNSSSDISPTGGQMPRLLGLAQASKIFKNVKELHDWVHFSDKGNEVAFGTIGDSSTSEGLFWESLNAAAVLHVPLCMSVWDNGWGISVPKKYQTSKESISEVLSGFELNDNGEGIKIFKVKGWNYAELVLTYAKAVKLCREQHVPVLVHVEELTQPQGHSTSGSHERYKSKELLDWYQDWDCLVQFKKFILAQGIATEAELDEIQSEAKSFVRQEQKEAWASFRASIDEDVEATKSHLTAVQGLPGCSEIVANFNKSKEPGRKDMMSAMHRVLRLAKGSEAVAGLNQWYQYLQKKYQKMYSSELYNEGDKSVLNIPIVDVQYETNAEWVDGRVILRDFWDYQLAKRPEVLIFGEDVGKIGGVNQTCEGLQEKYGELRVTDTGIREASILGQAIGMSMRGLRPVAEIQYLDYIYYALQIMRDDLASVRYRTAGGQKAPAIISTRGHRLEGIWHSGSPMGAIVHSVRGMVVCVPRNMTQAAGMYATLLESDEPALVVECLNGYRSKEPMPNNLGEYRTPIGIAEVVEEGEDLTLVSYGSTFHICAAAVKELREEGISIELVDARTLLPFDTTGVCLQSLKKTNRLLIVDEDVPGGASGYLLNDILNRQGGYQYLDSAPVTLAAKPHLPAYGTDGDYFSKPTVEDVIDSVLGIMREAHPSNFA